MFHLLYPPVCSTFMWNRLCLVLFFSNSSDVNLNTVPDWWIDVSQFSYYCCCAYGTSMFVWGHSCTYRTSDASSQGRVGGWWVLKISWLKALLLLLDGLIFLSRFVACGCRWHWWGVTCTYIQVLLNTACWVSFYLQSDLTFTIILLDLTGWYNMCQEQSTRTSILPGICGKGSDYCLSVHLYVRHRVLPTVW